MTPRSRFDRWPRWLAPSLIVVQTLLVAAVFLFPSPLEFPMDDTYIHFVYARNLVEQGRLMFNAPGEDGVGSTSLLWVLLLAGGHALGISIHVTAKLLGMASLVTVGVGVYALLRPARRTLPAWLAASLVTLSGNMLWFALSGMETMLFVALGVVALLVYRQERWAWLGIVLGLMPLVRPEGFAIAAAVGCVELWRCRAVRRGHAIAALTCVLVCGPWFGYLVWRTGHLLPTSAVGKQLSYAIATQIVAGQNDIVGALARFPPLVYVGLWIAFLLGFALGGMSLPPPCIPIDAVLDKASYSLSMWGILGWIAVVAPLLWVCGKRAAAVRKWAGWVQDRDRRPLITLVLWAAWHNLAFMIMMPVPGTASRYGAINHVLLWTGLVLGLFCFGRRARVWLGGALIVIAAANVVYWDGVYDANLDHMQNVRIAAARFVHDRLPADRRCAAFDVGALRYYGGRPIVDLAGLIDPQAGEWYLEGEFDRYLIDRGVSCVILPGRIGARDEGWFDVAGAYGMTITPLFEMREFAVFEIDHERWLQGYLATNNYQATVAMYWLDMADSEGE